MNETRGNLYLLTGLILGIACGVIYAWVISPIRYINTEPASLSSNYQQTYLQVVAQAYAADHNFARAQERVKLFDNASPARPVAAEAQRVFAANPASAEARDLAILAADLAQNKTSYIQPTSILPTGEPVTDTPLPPTPTLTATVGNAVQTATPTFLAPTPSTTVSPLPPPPPTLTLSPIPTFTPRATSTARAVQQAPFTLTKKQESCDPALLPGLLQVQVSDAQGHPLAGIKITVLWQEGSNIFYTGLIPEMNPGYADFVMKAGVLYTVKIGEASTEISDLKTAGACGWQLEFKQ